MEKGGITPTMLDEIVQQIWAQFVRLPEPHVFKWIQNEEVREFVFSLVRKRNELPKTLRV